MHIVTIVGARPQFIKAAVVSISLSRRLEVRESLVHTGQHYDRELSHLFFEELKLPKPVYNLEVGSGGHGVQTGRMLCGLEEILENEHPDWVLVYGDTNSTLAGALTAAKLNIPVAHVEGGMRSFNRSMPEEVNRILTDHLATLHLCVNHNAVRNLANDGIVDGVHVVGDVMYDAILLFKDLIARRPSPLDRLDLTEKGYIVFTCHRQENTDTKTRLKAVIHAVERLSITLPVIFLAHPRTVKAMKAAGLSPGEKVMILPPAGYLDTLELQRKAALVLTDSGGMQKESLFHGVPCITLRDETEWPETVEAGWNTLVGADEKAIIAASLKALERRPVNNPVRNLYGDGKAAEKIVDLLLRFQARQMVTS